MSEWIKTTLSEIADIRISNVDKKSYQGEEPVMLCNYMDVYSNDYINHNISFMEATANIMEIAKFTVSKGDVLITKDSESPFDIGIPSVVEEDIDNLICGYHLAQLKPDLKKVDPIFLAKKLALPEVSSYFSKVSAGSTRYGLSRGAIANVLISLPSLEKQKKIASILKKLDVAIAKTEEIINKYNQIKKGMMCDLFSRGLNKNGSLRERYESSPELYQETVVGLIPKEWSLQPLPSISTYQHGRPFPSSDYTDEGVFLLRPGNLDQNGFIRFDEAHSIKIPYYWERLEPNYIVRYGDILMNLTAQSLDDEFLGRVCINMEKVKSMLNQRIARFSTNKIDHEFLYWLLRSRQFRKQIDRTSQGTKVQHLYNRDLNRVILGVPSCTEEQRKIADALRTISEKIKIEEKYLQKLLKDKVGLMQDLLTGKVSVKVNKKDTEASHV
ncbi:restriction endonuclease subunit S [Salmonella enterica]|nr:restriction endonuclease subunit S [Salmonella enterica subsp. diarizonae]EIE5009010.1 restriction endonuclease subunit S [Salmonella enterica]EJU7195673.1 restriction endonuclease subunit S [Salmonella enterica]SQI66530.1 type I restriction-modification system specificty subunit [Salmonella enterica subsp. diarizonae]